MAEWFLFLPQSRLGIDDIVLRARTAETSGFDGVAFIDHLETPMAADAPIWEAMTIATWVAARTERLRIGHLVLCDAFRHPAVLAKQAVTLAEASGGRFELGLGSGSMPDELSRFGLGAPTAGQRLSALEQTVTAVKRYWAGGDDTQLPTPSNPIPLLLAGRGPRMLGLVARHADWWNLPATHDDELPDLLPKVGSARASVQQMVGFIGDSADVETVTAKAHRRFSQLGPGLVCGRADELVDYFSGLRRQGAQRFYVWFSDFAAPETIAEFGERVITALGE
jgi:alkanesulfonate monooxygenase SsuD/methylene tetrahydromethanopterin reductase-like flavin-dependent oxidoreductase (luciferase family)